MIAKGCSLRNQGDIASTGRHHVLERQSRVATPRQAFACPFGDMPRAAGAYRSDENDPKRQKPSRDPAVQQCPLIFVKRTGDRSAAPGFRTIEIWPKDPPIGLCKGKHGEGLAIRAIGAMVRWGRLHASANGRRYS